VPPELLAPAGDHDALRAAAENGADAVYFGLPNFNARQRARNFSPESLSETVDFLHDRNLRAYLTLNTLLFPSELAEAVSCISLAAASGIDAVIVQDLGIASLIHRMVPDLPLHASTQMTLSDPRGIALARELGIGRVILPRELPLPAIARLASECPLPLEVFVHGALCVSYSGQCFASHAIGGRSANRGQCAQPCRLPYDLLVDGHPRDLAGRRRLLSPHDLSAVDLIPALLKAGVAAFKIEGRLKSAEYVAIATRVYRRAIDDALAGRPHRPDPDAIAHLAMAFSRGTGHGHLDGVNHAALVDGRTEGNRGERLGTISGVTARGILLKPDRPGVLPAAGDGLVILPPAEEAPEQGGRAYAVRPAPGRAGLTEIDFAPEGIDLAAVPANAILRRTDAPALRKRVEAAAPRPRVHAPTRLDLHVSARAGGPLSLRAATPDGDLAEVTWPGPVSSATSRPADESLLRDQLSRLGGTPFQLGRIALDLPEAVLLPKSVLNELRRNLVAELLSRRRLRARRAVAAPHTLNEMRRDLRAAAPEAPPMAPRLYLLVREMSQLNALLDAPLRPDMVYCDFPSPRECAAALRLAQHARLPAAAVTQRILLPGEETDLLPLLDAAPDALLLRNLGALAWFSEKAPALPLIADFSLNATNELSVAALRAMGASRVTPALDLDLSETLRVAGAGLAAHFEIVLHRRVPLMHTEHCPAAAFLAGPGRPCEQTCRRHRLALRDRMGVDYALRTDSRCRTTLFFGKPLSWIPDARRLLAAGCRHFRIELLDESPAEIAALLRETRDALA
jgi:putative protease